MRKLLLVVLLLASTTATADEFTTDQKNAAMMIIRINGYSCATVDSMRNLIWSEGFSVACNGYQYVYSLKDHGGKWIVTVE